MMKEVIGVRFRQGGKIYYFSPLNYKVDVGRNVIVETTRGVEYGKVVLGVREIDETNIPGGQIKPIIRIATKDDDARNEENKEKSKKAYEIGLEKIRKHQLEMKLISAEYTFDGNKVLFYFTADGRIDFRELVKDLASVFRTRIELRQVGVRDETKLRGGIGMCGRELCCHSHLSDFVPVSIKMAKEQNLSLNPTKISGVCGRLMCCLSHEQATYEYLNDKLPNVGDFVKTVDGKKGEVQSVNVLRQKVKIVVTLDDNTKEVEEYRIEDLRFKPKKKKSHDRDENDAELKKLEALERKEGKMEKLS
jgi:cell fate regulator YaaT (PSP1 superfamily)